MVQVKKNIDIFIITPNIDGFSASISEALYSGGIVITGRWLPYSRYDAHAVYIEWVDHLEEIGSALKSILNDIEGCRRKTLGNKEKVLEVLDYKGNLEKWVQLFEN